MKMTVLAALGVTLLGSSLGAFAADEMTKGDKMKSHMASIDANGDGKISKDEFMSHHEKMWMGMKKDANGMVDAKSMMSQHEAMMKDHDKMKQ